jgi:hypothetical protein
MPEMLYTKNKSHHGYVARFLTFSDPRSSALISSKLLPFAMALAFGGPVMASLVHENKKHA